MKLFILLVAVAACQAARLDKTYLPPHAQSSGGSDGALQAPARDGHGGLGFGPAPDYRQATLDRTASILRQDSASDGERYSYSYDTENGIHAEESGAAVDGVEAQGGFSYTGDDGQVYSVRYSAGRDGFVPQGEHLPTPPPVPEEILRALEQNARDEAAGIYDDGTYDAAKYGDADTRAAGYAYPAGGPPADLDSVAVDAAPRAAPAQMQASFGLQKAYLPPFAGQRTAGRQSYNPRTGYRY